MRASALAVALLVVVFLLAPPTRGAQDYAAFGYVTRLIQIVSTPQLEPGQSGDFVFHLNSTYPSGMIMQNVSVEADIYEYATIDQAIPIDRNWTYPYPVLRSTVGEAAGRSWWWNASSVFPGSVTNLSFTVVTSSDSDLMPYGSIFSQATYFVRFRLDFDGLVGATIEHFRMESKGYFSPSLWAEATNTTNTTPCTPPWCRGNLNLTILGVDGVLPDSSFGVLEPIPRWPFYLLIALAVFFVILAFLFWVEENPGTYPRVETWWARQRGRLNRLRPRRRRRLPEVHEKEPPKPAG